jgi:hypothetical protein
VTAEVERICAAMYASGYSYELRAFDDASTDESLARLYEAAPPVPADGDHPVPPQRLTRHGPPHWQASGRRGEIVVWIDADMTYPNEGILERSVAGR